MTFISTLTIGQFAIMGGVLKAFLAAVQNLTSKDLEVPAEACSELVRMAGELALEETSFSKIQERNRADAPIAFH